MNVRPSIHELDRIRRDIGARLRIEHEVAEPPPQRLMALLKELEIHVHVAQGERLFAEVDARVAELKRAAGREPWGQGYPGSPKECGGDQEPPAIGRL